MAAPLRILMVDDDPADRAVVERDLRRGLPNAAIEWAPDATSLVRALETGGFEVVVTDFVLAWTNGLSILRDVKARYPECPVIMYTSTGSEMIAVEGMKAGLDDYVVKAAPHGARLPAAVQSAIDRARSRAVAREAEARYRNLFLGVPVGLFRATPECRLLDANPALRQMLTLPAEGPVTEVDLRTLFVDPAEGGRWVAMIGTAGVVKGLEASLRRTDGTVIWVRGSGRAVRDGQGRLQYCEGEFEEITSIKQAEHALQVSEEKYRKLVETANDAIFLADAETGVILDANPRAETLLGRTRQEIIGLHQSALHPPDTEVVARQTFEEHVRIGPATTSRLMALHKSGRRIPLDISTAVLELGGRRVIQGIFRDVSERRHLEEQLRHTQKIEAIGRLAGGVAHDFNNLLSAIIGFGQLAFMKMEASNPLRRYLDEVLKAADRGTSLTRQLLSFSRKQVHEPVEIDLNEVVKDMDRMLRRLVGEDVVFQVRLEPRLGRMRADRGQLEQVVMNLVVNARDAMPQGGALTLETTNEALDAKAARRFIDGLPGDYVSLRVTDTGHGMDVETRAHLFEPFFTTKDHGTGLGLSTIYGIVRQGGGQIDVDSEPGRGSTFRILFPRVEPETAPASNRLLSDVVPSGTETVLVVEDEEAVRTMVREILSVKGYTVLDAGDGNEALDLAERHPGPIHLVLTDVVMTGPGGPEVADRLRARRPDVKVLFMSGYPDVALLRKGGKDLLHALLPKPFTPDVLARRVRETIDRS